MRPRDAESPVGTRRRDQKHFQANTASPLFAELRGIVLKTVALAEPLRTALKPLSSSIRAAFVYGSVAKATDRATSDIDLMIISDSLTYGEVFGVLERVSKTLGRQVSRHGLHGRGVLQTQPQGECICDACVGAAQGLDNRRPG